MTKEKIQPERGSHTKVFPRKDIEDENGRIDMDFFNTLMEFQYGTGKGYENAADKLFSKKWGRPNRSTVEVKKEKRKKGRKRSKVKK